MTAPLLVALLLAAPGAALEPSEISRKSREKGTLNLVGLEATLRLTTTAKDGTTRQQTLVTSAKRSGGRLRSRARFLSPSGVAGVTVLTIEGEGEAPDEISLYLPKLRRVRKVAPSQRGQPFMNTDFSYADLGGTQGEDEAVTRLPDETLDGRKAYVLRGRAHASSPYGEVTVTVDQETFVPLKAEYEDKQGKPVKRFRAASLKTFGNRVIAEKATMENLETGSTTTLEVLSLREATLPDVAYTERGLERG
jgi:outer membrane lipoprotein-sorting protein